MVAIHFLDIDFLVWPVINGMAEFWESRVLFNASCDCYEILEVVPPDEIAGIVNNSGTSLLIL